VPKFNKKERIKSVNAEELQRVAWAMKHIGKAKTVLFEAMELTMDQLKEVSMGDPTVDPTIALDREVTFTVGDLCDIWDELREAKVQLHLVRADPFTVVATGRYGDPLSTWVPEPSTVISEAEDITRGDESE
jgi:hypothetical protein